MSATVQRQAGNNGPLEESQGAAIWFTGLPGCGKSSIARAVRDALAVKGLPVIWLEMDRQRKIYVPHPQYTTEERHQAYALFAKEAAQLVAEGHIVLMDGTAPEKSMRNTAREQIERFAEVHIQCSLKTAMERESKRPEGKVMAGLYAKAVKRKATGEQFEGLGEVIGVDTPFEVDPNAELILNSEELTVQSARATVLRRFAAWL
ncbi:adenylyl-sulfate kinase [Desulfovibrio inopinatus]|uniref:adenylyl-sulfate kinase n=1 Tax=Desulfovibrio inopinatus TaxID=102109 RepID=UPI00041275D1|nr:adenylyl-sulfate kinase [Desulfovibrio inopinatus]